ncbi:hypothetical protein AB3G45_19055 [Shinella sp. S4-D37]|uniref:hypothetical protein n=1 Tax=Shinella sp. S4-D37 TaxID=3161999 RepID=UPI003464FA9C
MGNPTPRLPFSSFDGPTPELNLTEEDWLELEVLLERKIHASAREKLLHLVSNYFDHKRAEDNAATYADALRAVGQMEKQLAGFWELVHAPDQSDASYKVMADFEYFLRSSDIPLSPTRLSMRDPETGEDYETALPTRYELTMNDVSNVAIEMKVALNRVRQDYEQAIAEKPKHFEPGSSFKRFGVKVRAWASEHEFPKGFLDKTNRPDGTPLAIFLFRLNQHFPEAYRSSVKRASALGRRLERELEAK